MSEKYAFIFDMDGVIADNMSYHAQSWIELFRDKGHHVSLDDFCLYAAGRKAEEVVRHYLNRSLTADEINCLAEQKDVLYRYMYRPHLKPLNGLLSFIEKSSALGISMGVGTGSSPGNIAFVLSNLNLHDHFSSVVGAAQVKKGKPDPEIFLTVASQLNVNPENCMVFEDSQFGIQAATTANMKVVGLTTSHSKTEIETFGNLTDIVKDFTELDPQRLISTF